MFSPGPRRGPPARANPGAARGDQSGPVMGGKARATTRTICSPRSSAGSPRASIPPISKRRKRSSMSWHEPASTLTDPGSGCAYAPASGAASEHDWCRLATWPPAPDVWNLAAKTAVRSGADQVGQSQFGPGLTQLGQLAWPIALRQPGDKMLFSGACTGRGHYADCAAEELLAAILKVLRVAMPLKCLRGARRGAVWRADAPDRYGAHQLRAPVPERSRWITRNLGGDWGNLSCDGPVTFDDGTSLSNARLRGDNCYRDGETNGNSNRQGQGTVFAV